MQKVDENLSSSIIGEDEDEIDVSDIDIDVLNDGEEDFIFADLNFREEEWSIARCPFPHWTVNRQMYTS